MAKHAADNGGFFGLFKKKKEGYYDFTDTARTKKKYDDYEDSIYSDLKKDYTVVNNSDIEDNGADIAYNNTTSLNNLVSNEDNGASAGASGEKESTQAVNTINDVSVNTKFDGKLYQSSSNIDSKYDEMETHVGNTDSHGYSNGTNDYGEDSSFVNGYEYDYQDYDEGAGSKKIVIIIAIVLLIAAVAFFFFFMKWKNNTEEIPVEEENVEEAQEKMIPSLSGFKVLGKINIDSIDVEQYILDSTSNEALDVGVGKIDNGASLNSKGNFCIAGHNRDGIFKNLNSLVEGSEIKITDPDLNESIYIVKELRDVPPDNLEILLQDKTKDVITLITCKDGAIERQIVIAERK
ncbi:MAG: sortase [Clostridia bacterium]|nr:sortase [Clostridia bacterium]